MASLTPGLVQTCRACSLARLVSEFCMLTDQARCAACDHGLMEICLPCLDCAAARCSIVGCDSPLLRDVVAVHKFAVSRDRVAVPSASTACLCPGN